MDDEDELQAPIAATTQEPVAEPEFSRDNVKDPALQSLFKQLDRIEATQTRIAQRFL